jgi:hypothetical protein
VSNVNLSLIRIGNFAQWYCLFIYDRHLNFMIPSCVLFFSPWPRSTALTPFKSSSSLCWSLFVVQKYWSDFYYACLLSALIWVGQETYSLLWDGKKFGVLDRPPWTWTWHYSFQLGRFFNRRKHHISKRGSFWQVRVRKISQSEWKNGDMKSFG